MKVRVHYLLHCTDSNRPIPDLTSLIVVFFKSRSYREQAAYCCLKLGVRLSVSEGSSPNNIR